ncbi:MAG: cupin domain-containing protein [Halioglobus sp.]|nr:cupin domain-containing protein [Halioglobus sp.]
MVTVTPSGHPVRALESSEVIKATPILNVQQTWIGQPISYPVGEAELSGVVIEMAPGGETGWHQHPVPSVGYVMEGELEVHFKDGEIKHLKAGEAAAEAINVLHNGVNNGDTPVKLVIFYIGRVGSQLTIPENTE